MFERQDKKNFEYELKYLKAGPIYTLEVLEAFRKNGFMIISIHKTENSDNYYDTLKCELYNNHGSFRIRKSKGANLKYKGTFKMPTSSNEVYTSRNEIEEDLKDDDFTTFIEVMKKANIPFNLDCILPVPVINVSYSRTNLILERNNKRVCLSIDDVKYIYYQHGNVGGDMMVEIELDGNDDTEVLNDVHRFLTKEIDDLNITKESKYERAMTKAINIKKDKIINRRI